MCPVPRSRIAGSKPRSHSITGTVQFGDDAVDLGLLPFEPLDALIEFLQRDFELRHLPVADVVEVEHLAHFLEREADRLAGEHVGEPRAVAPRVEALLAAPRRIDEALFLVEAQRARRDAEFLGEIADGEDVAAARRAGIRARCKIGDEADAVDNLHLGHALLSTLMQQPLTSSLRKRKDRGRQISANRRVAAPASSPEGCLFVARAETTASAGTLVAELARERLVDPV